MVVCIAYSRRSMKVEINSSGRGRREELGKDFAKEMFDLKPGVL